MKVVDRDGDFNFVLLIGLAGLLITVGFTVGVFRHPQDLTHPLTWVAAGVAVACLGSTGFILREQAREDRFRAWLLEHCNELYQGGATYHGITLDAGSPIYRYTYMFSLGVVRFTVPGRPLVLGLDDLRRARRGYNIVTFLFGWWFITGPLFTPLVLYRNFKSPQPISIAQYMHQMGRSGPVGVA